MCAIRQPGEDKRKAACRQPLLFLPLSGVIAGNIGLLYWEVGDINRALTYYALALDVALAVGDQPSILTCLGNMALVFYEQKRDGLAECILERAIALGRELNLPYQQCEHLDTMTNLLIGHGKYADVAILNYEALALAERVNDDEVSLRVRLLDARLRVFTGQASASIVVNELSQRLDNLTNDGLAAVYYTIWQVDSTREDMRQAAADSYRRLNGQMPKHEYRARYAELTGTILPKASAFASLPRELVNASDDLDLLLYRAGVELAITPRQEVTTPPLPL